MWPSSLRAKRLSQAERDAEERQRARRQRINASKRPRVTEQTRVKDFEVNKYNFVPASLAQIAVTPDETGKGRGVVASQDIPQGTIVCLFPGIESDTTPILQRLKDGKYLHNDEEKLLDSLEEEYNVATSSYTFRLAVQVYDCKLAFQERVIGYRWRYLEPLSEKPQFTSMKMKRVLIGWQKQAHCWLANIPKNEETAASIQRVEKNIKDSIRVLERQILDLKVPSKYKYMGAFINEPYSDQAVNLTWLNPDEWIPDVYTKMLKDLGTNVEAYCQEHRLIRAEVEKFLKEDTRSADAPDVVRGHVDRFYRMFLSEKGQDCSNVNLDFLQRPAFVASRHIRKGEELLVAYNRNRKPSHSAPR